MRLQAEQQRNEIERKLIEYQQQMKDIHETLVDRRSLEIGEFLDEKIVLVEISRSSRIISTKSSY